MLILSKILGFWIFENFRYGLGRSDHLLPRPPLGRALLRFKMVHRRPGYEFREKYLPSQWWRAAVGSTFEHDKKSLSEIFKKSQNRSMIENVHFIEHSWILDFLKKFREYYGLGRSLAAASTTGTGTFMVQNGS